jgi:hypothetical protein
VFHVRALYHTKTLITNKCTKRVWSSIVTRSYMFRPCWVIFREHFFVIVTLRSHFTVEWECAVDCVLCTGGVNSVRSRTALQCRPGPQRIQRLQKQHSTQSTAHSHSTVNCNLSVRTTKFLPEDDPAGSKHVGVCYNRWKNSLCICWWLVFLNNLWVRLLFYIYLLVFHYNILLFFSYSDFINSKLTDKQ